MTSKVTAVHRGGDRGNCNSYGIVNLTSTTLKTLDGILCNSMVNHLGERKLVIVEYNSFQHKRSCLTNLGSFLEGLTRRMKGNKQVEIRCLEVQKALDYANHRGIDQHLKAFGVDRKVNIWIAQDQKGRSFRARVEGCLLSIRLLYS